MEKQRILGDKEFLHTLKNSRQPFHDGYFAMYSSVMNGIVTDPTLMLVPIDDHMVHRGDAVFETLKCTDGSVYNLQAHFSRLRSSAERIELNIRWTDEDLIELLRQTVRAGKHRDSLIRILLSRGPGSLGVNPYDCPSPQLYIIAVHLPDSFMSQHPEGASVAYSSIPVKASYLATAKTCNYLPNALMRKEAADRGVHFVIALDENGHLAESATENMMVLSPERILLLPTPENILAGTTMNRVMKLAESLLADQTLAGIQTAGVTLDAILKAPELFIVGTTPNVTAVVAFDGKPVGTGKPGPVFEKLSRLLLDDIHNNSTMRTALFE